MTCLLHGIGTADSGNPLSQADALGLALGINDRTGDLAPWLQGIFDHAGIDRRSICVGPEVLADLIHRTRTTDSVFLPKGPDDAVGPTTGERMGAYWEIAAPMATRAAQIALAESGVPAESLTHLITVTCTGFRAPGLDHALIQNLTLSPEIERTQVGFMGCHGALNGLRVAKAFTEANPAANVLVVAAEVCTVHYHYGDSAKHLVGNALFADGAGAVVLRGRDSEREMEGNPNPSQDIRPIWRLAATGSCVIPNSAGAMTWEIGDHGFEMTLSTKIPGLIGQHLRPWLDRWLERAGLSVAEVSSWAIHPGGPKILTAVEEILQLTREQTTVSWNVLKQHGNMSSATALYLFQRLRQQNAPMPMVSLGFGPGMAVEAVLWR
ncbi:type III polyketide synthase [Tuwongella immobilis]|uniref:Chalcone/stilbene synthase N-terminal domain-containing protein n=1 Tax=Tuwongella immobilis TaxID=692036 RepID=A0A6C2YVY9_9BACT|nr:type III polyketide synthase [Tuwongella immobilis]VIP05614.1 chalcone synthase : Chalcone synthase (CHS) OS=Synechococcus sp. (strain WH7805) GN=WH7805_01547 PE=4 SV=1: Chal_sti_synt_N: Chal_sti_synt_C [Tuwongella immobilis]VTS08584.1 chalcone synthase : Chalcone synthase (CHS) OS=Synechococcus sp. (strain WH7805) GN=WH7805_01547 PE=4 SV=1: Chal_sti_synt_N: Chal_sti_synt_C [Tuwongella immobilis]